MPTLGAGNALDVANAVANELPLTTSQTARELYKVLVEVAVRVEEARGHAPNVTEAVIHLPIELLCDVVAVSRWTAWRHLPQLRALGVVDYRAHKASCRGHTRNSGTVWRVRLSPLQGSRARVSADDLRHRWRGRDMRGAASYKCLHHTKTLESRLLKIAVLTEWAVNPGYQNPVSSVWCNGAQTGLEALLDLTGARKQERAQAVNTAALALSQALRDSSSLNWYRRLLWSLLRRFDAIGRDDTRVIYLTAQRAFVDTQELKGLRRPGALFHSRLRGDGWLAELMGAPPVRVGVRPSQN